MEEELLIGKEVLLAAMVVAAEAAVLLEAALGAEKVVWMEKTDSLDLGIQEEEDKEHQRALLENQQGKSTPAAALLEMLFGHRKIIPRQAKEAAVMAAAEAARGMPEKMAEREQ